MKLIEFLEENRSRITEKWLRAVIDTYPVESGKFLFDNQNQFSNPLGYTISENLPEIFNELLESKEPERLYKPLEAIIKIRAVQEYSPSEAVGFLYLLKQIIRDEFYHLDNPNKPFRSLLEFESKIDQAVSMAFDIYSGLKEKIYEIKANEVRDRFGKMVDRLNTKYGD